MPHKPAIKPKRLLPGATVGVVAPAGWVNLEDLERGVAEIEQLGFRVLIGNHATKRRWYLAGSDRERADDFLGMFQTKEVSAILCARGGAGSARIIPYLDLALLASFPKIVVGCSDITTLLLYLSRSLGWVTFHGPMVATQLGKGPTAILKENFTKILSGEMIEMKFPGVTPLRPGMAEGILSGGCLTLICTTIGTPYEIETDHTILFLEDTHEPAYRIDRMLTYLKLLKKFDHVRGVIFGQMVSCQTEILPEIILEILGDFRFPILFGFPSGHGDGTATLPFGISVRLDAKEGILSMCEPAVR